MAATRRPFTKVPDGDVDRSMPLDAGSVVILRDVQSDMVLKPLLLALGIVEAVVPRRMVDFWMDLAVADERDVEIRPWVYTVARIEGLVIVAWVIATWLRGTGTADDAE